MEQTLSLLMWHLHRGGPQEAVYWRKECLQKTSMPFICSVGYSGDWTQGFAPVRQAFNCISNAGRGASENTPT